MELNGLKKDFTGRIEKTLEVLNDKLKGLRGSSASPTLVEGVKVEYYGSPTPLKQVAAISVPEPKQIIIKPFDPTILQGIEKAIQSANIGLTPMSDGKLIRLNIPPLSEERRNQLIDQVKKFGEEARVSIRNVRRDVLKNLDSLEKEKKLTEDQKFKERDLIQKKVDEYEKKIQEVIDNKIGQIRE